MTTSEKCGHPMCKCMVSEDGRYGNYCSEHCQDAKDVTELKCDCKHRACH